MPDNTVKTPSRINDWAKSIKLKALDELTHFKNDKDGYTECRITAENEDIILCGTFLQRDMNAFLLRATIYAEGGIGDHVKKTIVAVNDKHIRANQDVIAGHDLTSQDLLAFYSLLNRYCREGKTNSCLTARETTFYNQVIKPLSYRTKPYVLITFSVQSASPASEIVSHEFIHAIYFLDPNYKTKINNFWNNYLSQSERHQIKSTLKEIGYNETDEALMENEFQAYMLMQNAENARLDMFVAKYRGKLQQFLTAQ